MASLKRKRQEPEERTAVDPVILDNSDDANALTKCQGDATVAEPPAKGRKADTHICTNANSAGVLYRSTTSSELDEPGFPEDAWGKDRAVLSEAISSLASSVRNQTQDGSLLGAISSLQYVASSLHHHPGRSPGYKRAQFKMQGQSKLLQLPREIRNIIWQHANPPKLGCFFAGLKAHEPTYNTYLCEGDWRTAFTHLSDGRGLPVSRQILRESQAVAQPTGCLCCGRGCLLRAQFALACWGGCEPESRSNLTVIRQWSSIRRIEVLTAKMRADDCDDFCRLASGWKRKEGTDQCWKYHIEDGYYVLEKVCGHSAVTEEPQAICLARETSN